MLTLWDPSRSIWIMKKLRVWKLILFICKNWKPLHCMFVYAHADDLCWTQNFEWKWKPSSVSAKIVLHKCAPGVTLKCFKIVQIYMSHKLGWACMINCPAYIAQIGNKLVLLIVRAGRMGPINKITLSLIEVYLSTIFFYWYVNDDIYNPSIYIY